MCTPIYCVLPWAHTNAHPKRRLDQFSRFCAAAHGRESLLLYNGPPLSLPLKLLIRKGRPELDPHLICVSMDPHKSAIQTAFRSFEPLCRAHDYDRQTDRQTRYSVCNNRPHLHSTLRCGVKGLTIEKVLVCSPIATVVWLCLP